MSQQIGICGHKMAWIKQLNQEARRDTFTAVSLVDIDGHIMSVHVFTGSSLSTHLCYDVVF